MKSPDPISTTLLAAFLLAFAGCPAAADQQGHCNSTCTAADEMALRGLATRVAALEQAAAGGPGTRPVVYVGMAADLLHHGHVKLIQTASTYGRVVVGLLTDEAIESYKRKPIVPWEDRRILVASLVGVSMVIPQATLDYRSNLRTLRPDVVVHGDDWKNGRQSETRQQVIDTLHEWGGKLVEPPYTRGISTTDLIRRVQATPLTPDQQRGPANKDQQDIDG